MTIRLSPRNFEQATRHLGKCIPRPACLIPEKKARISDDKPQEGKKKKEDFVRIKDLSVEEQTRIVQKWHGMTDCSAPLEVRRYQVLLAARLHARCQEPSVRKAMASLQTTFSNNVTVDELSNADPDVVANCISNLQFYNVKARQVVQAAQEIKSRFQGIVPEDEESLSQITGIGKCFADLLAFVNTRAKYKVANDTRD